MSGTSVAFPPDLLEAARAKGVSLDYPSFAAYINSLVRLDAIHPERFDHDLAKRIVIMTPRKRDQIDRKILLDTQDALAQWMVADERAEQELNERIAARFPASPSPPSLPTAFQGLGAERMTHQPGPPVRKRRRGAIQRGGRQA